MTVSTDFAADRRTAQDEAVEALAPIIADALEQRETEPADSQTWTEEITAAATAIYLAIWAQETNAQTVGGIPAFQSMLIAQLMTATRDPNRAAQINRLSLWLGVASINAAIAAVAAVDPTALEVEWITMGDASVREIHQTASGQRRGIGQPFNIGEFQLDYPGQPVGPPHVWIECRCSLRIVREEMEMTEALVAATQPWQQSDWQGGMVALKPVDPTQIAVEGGYAPEEMHVTLFFLGDDVSGLPEAAVQAIHAGADKASRMLPTTARIAGVGKLGDGDATVLFLNGDGMESVRGALVGDMYGYGSEAYEEQHQPWLPHITLGYGLDPTALTDLIGREVQLGSVDVHLANDVTSYAAQLDDEALVASLSPGDWFSNPNLTGPTPPTLEDCGRFYGHIATWEQCHLGYPGICKTAPHSTSDYAYFHTGVVRTADGDIPVGQVTLGTGHANNRLNSNNTLAHYDNTGTAVADVVVGEDEYGIWFSGAIRAGVDDRTVDNLRAAALSGDWRKIRGNLELVAALAVNVPGFPVPRTGLHIIDGQQVSLVASGILVPEGDPELTRSAQSLANRSERLQRLRGRTRNQRLAALRRQIRQ